MGRRSQRRGFNREEGGGEVKAISSDLSCRRLVRNGRGSWGERLRGTGIWGTEETCLWATGREKKDRRVRKVIDVLPRS